MNSPADHVRLGYLAFVEQARLAIGACRNYNIVTFPVAGCSCTWQGLLWAGNRPNNVLIADNVRSLNKIVSQTTMRFLLLPGMSAEQALI